MKRILLAACVVCFSSSIVAHSANAAVVNRACLQSDRKAATRQLCRCIDRVARGTLSGRQQRLAAALIREPLRSQDIRFSDRPNHERFWESYKKFSSTAERVCK